MRDEKTKKKKIMGAILSSIFFSLYYLLLIGTMSYFQIIEEDKTPWILYILLMLAFMILTISICYNLIVRIREIKGGEEDEASKY